jgi:hypothetical protein
MPAAAAAYKSDSLMLLLLWHNVNAMHLCHKLCAWQVLFTISNYLYRSERVKIASLAVFTLQFGH